MNNRIRTAFQKLLAIRDSNHSSLLKAEDDQARLAAWQDINTLLQNDNDYENVKEYLNTLLMTGSFDEVKRYFKSLKILNCTIKDSSSQFSTPCLLKMVSCFENAEAVERLIREFASENDAEYIRHALQAHVHWLNYKTSTLAIPSRETQDVITVFLYSVLRTRGHLVERSNEVDNLYKDHQVILDHYMQSLTNSVSNQNLLVHLAIINVKSKSTLLNQISNPELLKYFINFMDTNYYKRSITFLLANLAKRLKCLQDKEASIKLTILEAEIKERQANLAAINIEIDENKNKLSHLLAEENAVKSLSPTDHRLAKNIKLACDQIEQRLETLVKQRNSLECELPVTESTQQQTENYLQQYELPSSPASAAQFLWDSPNSPAVSDNDLNNNNNASTVPTFTPPVNNAANYLVHDNTNTLFGIRRPTPEIQPPSISNDNKPVSIFLDPKFSQPNYDPGIDEFWRLAQDQTHKRKRD